MSDPHAADLEQRIKKLIDDEFDHFAKFRAASTMRHVPRNRCCHMPKMIAFAFTTLLPAPSFAQVSADGVAATLGPAMALASMCARPTAPIELELEHYLQKVGAGPLETNRVRQAMMSAAAGWHGQYSTLNAARPTVKLLTR